METAGSLFDKFVSRHRPIGVRITLLILILALPFIAVWADHGFDSPIPFSSWRGLLIPPVVIVYIFAVSPGMERKGQGVLRSFRSIIILDEEDFQNLVNQAGSIPANQELLAIFIGGILGFVSSLGSGPLTRSWVSLYWIASNILMYALVVWIIYASIASTRFTNTLLRQSLKIDPFDISPFEPIGRQSLLNALVFMGGITVSLIFVAWDFTILTEPGFWLIYIPLGMIPLVVFFFNMFPTHRVLAETKKKELIAVRKHFQQACRQLLAIKDAGETSGILPAEINALSAYQAQLQGARTWPYDTGMLRTLFFSVLIPVGTLVGRIIIEALSN